VSHIENLELGRCINIWAERSYLGHVRRLRPLEFEQRRDICGELSAADT